MITRLCASLFAVILGVCGTAAAVPRAYIPSINGTVSVVDTSTNTVVGGPITVGNSPIGVAAHPNGTRVYVGNGSSNTVSVIDTTSETVIATIAVGNFPYGLALDPTGARLYVANAGALSVSVIDTATNSVVATIAGVGGPGDSPYSVAVSPSGNFVYAVNRTNTNRIRVAKIDTVANSVVSMTPVFGVNFNFVTVHGVATASHVYVTSAADNAVYVLDPTTLALV